MEIQFEQRCCVRYNEASFINWNCVDTFRIPGGDPEKFFVRVPS